VHVPSEPSLGYTIVEERHRLRRELVGADEQEIARIARERGRDAVTERYQQRLFAYGGDSVAIKPELIQGTEILCHDTTFLDEQDRKDYKHATLAEAVATAREAGVRKKLLAFHISSRYRSKVKEAALNARFQGLDFEVVLVPPGRVFVLR
jgi:ribonuclease Z